MARRILITGAKGFVGTYLCSALAQRHPDDIIVPLATMHEATTGVRAADLLDRAAIDAAVADVEPEVIIHLAGQSSVARGSVDASETWAVNLTGSLNLALAAARHVPDVLLLFASSSEVYGASFLTGPVSETTATLPMNAYARSKRLAEDMFDAVLPASAKLIVARPFNHTGAGQREDFVLPSFAAQIARIEAGKQPPQLSVGNLDVRRDFLDVSDVVDAYILLLETASNLPKRFACNVASGEARPLRERVELFRDLAKVAFEIVVDPARLRAVDLPTALGDASLLRATTGWRPRIAMRETLGRLLEAARTNIDSVDLD